MPGIGLGIRLRTTPPFAKGLIAELFRDGGGTRVGVRYTSAGGGVSWDDLIAQNESALGPELVTTPTILGVAAGGPAVSTYATGATVVAGRAYWVVLRVSGYAGSGDVGLSSGTFGAQVRATADGLYTVLARAEASGNVSAFSRTTNTANFSGVSIRELTDWSKLQLFNDSAGTDPVLSPVRSGEGLGLLLDRSQGLIYGSNTFSDANVSFTGASTRVSAGVYRVYTPDGTYTLVAGTAFASTAGKWYEVTFNIDSVTTAGGGLQIEAVETVTTIAATVGPKRAIVKATGTALGIKRASGATDVQVSAVTVREVPGNHAQQPTAAARGEFSRRYNLLLNSQDFTAANWVKNAATVTPNATVAPDGTTTASRLVESTATSDHSIRGQVVSTVVGVRYKQSLYVKAGERTKIQFYEVSGSGGIFTVDCLTGGIVINAGTPNPTTTDVGNGWWRVEYSEVATTTSTTFLYSGMYHVTLGISYTGDGTSGMYFWGGDVRLDADAASGLPKYQRVTSASDYDEAGFPTYHRAQTDDNAFADINPAGATKALVLWAVQKMSDVSAAVMLEYGPSVFTTDGSLSFGGPETAGVAEIKLRARGTTATGASTSVIAASKRVALQGRVDLQVPSIELFSNGVSGGVNASAIGAASFAAQRLYIGSRAGTSGFANVRTFAPPLLLFMQSADPGPTAAQLRALDKLYNACVRAF